MKDINYLIQQLRDIGFNEFEITVFLTIIYTNLIIYNKDLESQIAYLGNQRYIDAFSLLEDDIYNITLNEFNEWSQNYIKYLTLSDSKLTELKVLSLTDSVLNGYITMIIADTDDGFSDSLPIYGVPDELTLSWKAFFDLIGLAFCYRWTKDSKYFIRAKEILNVVCNFTDWDPTHFLDVGMMAVGVSLAVSWLKEYLSPSEKTLYYGALKTKCLDPALVDIGNTAYWTYTDSNWSLVCWNGVIHAALVYADIDSSYRTTLIPLAVTHLATPLNTFAPDGVWFEGPGYTRVVLQCYSWLLAALYSIMGTRYSLDTYTGLSNAANFTNSLEGRSGLQFNPQDANSVDYRVSNEGNIYLGLLFNNDDVIAKEQEFVARATHYDGFHINPVNPFHVIFYKQVSTAALTHTHKYYGGTNPYYFLDDNTYGTDSIWVATKAGQNGTSHSHLDLGEFVFDALGQRWSRDLGSDSYSIDGYNDYVHNGARWLIYRLNSTSHSVPLINGTGQIDNITCVYESHSEGTSPYAIINLAPAYSTYANSVMRGIKPIDNFHSIIVQDEFNLIASQEVVWAMTTNSTITIVNDTHATLTLNGKTLYATVLSPATGVFSIGSTTPPASPTGQNPNTGTSRLLCTVPSSATTLFTVGIQLSPDWDGYHSADGTITPLIDWIVPTQWSLDMLASYLSINSHVTYSSGDQAIILQRLCEGYIIDTFGPTGLNKTVCDFFLFFKNSNTTTPITTRTITKTGATLRWNYGNGAIYSTNNNIPAQINNGSISVTSSDGFASVTAWNMYTGTFTSNLPSFQYFTGMTSFRVDSNTFSGVLPSFATCTKLSTFYCNANSFSGTLPSFVACTLLSAFNCSTNSFTGSLPSFATCTALVSFYMSGTGFTGSLPSFVTCPLLSIFYCYGTSISGETTNFSGNVLTDVRMSANAFTLNGTSSFAPGLTSFRVDSNALSIAEVNELFSNANTYYTTHTPTHNLTINTSGGTNGSPTGGQSNTDIVALKALYVTAGYVFTATIN